MFRLLVLTACLLFACVGAWAKQKPKPPPKSAPHQKMLVNLLKRCEDGIAVACYDYGKTFIVLRGDANKRKGNKYIRRACTLAYAPACQIRSVVAESKTVKDTKPKVDGQGKPCNSDELAKSAKLGEDGRSVAEVKKGSLWEQSGVQPGDVVLTVNGVSFSGPDQIGEALDKGGAVLNVLRNGRETSLMVNCP